ncbi:MAG: SEC-C domain-containing protein [Ardenticatenaceae bacterium]|nr:SEC-C domain-containing protein [Ardenticatenaceae bacterium]MCB8946233.1 SEC-C domain-containing protein [Ardenticatenaceae bacterium]
MKIGRNDDCYCGSGLKYKKCHMKIDQDKEKAVRASQQAVQWLGRDLLAFARDERFAEAFAQTLPEFWDGHYSMENAEEMSMDEALRFADWFAFDHIQPDGSRLIEVYKQEKWDELSEVQQQVLAGWLEAGAFTGYELLDYDGQILQLREYFTGEEFEVYEPSGRGDVEVGEVILARLVKVLDRWEFSTAAAYLPADEIGDIQEKIAAAKTADQAEHPDASHTDFMRRHNHMLVQHALEQAKLKKRPPVARLDPDRPDKKTQAIARQIRKRFG